jgi:hypothetical protein
MNPSNPPTTPEPSALTEVPANAGPGLILETLLKRPALLIEALHRGGTRATFWLGGSALLALAAYGLLIGSFSGGDQLIAAPLKVSLGTAFSMLICLPSFFIFACLTGADISLRAITGVLCAALALTSLLLIGFAPVAWVFSQSTESIGFIGFLHLAFWLISLAFGLRLLRVFMDVLRVKQRVHLQVWTGLFILVTMQMTASLRPIIGTAPHWLPTEKKFFLEHWFESISDHSRTRGESE